MATGNLFVPRLDITTGDPATVNDTSSQLHYTGQLGQWGFVYPTTSYWSTFALGGRPLAIQYVKRSATDAATLEVGALAFVKDYDDFVVTTDASDSLSTANNIYNCVGVFVGALPAPGNHGFIAIGGVAPLLLKGSPTVAADATGALVAVPEASTDLAADSVGATQIGTTPDIIRRVVAKILSAKNTPTGIGTNVVKGELFPYKGGLGGF
jgi:hypothetical protein